MTRTKPKIYLLILVKLWSNLLEIGEFLSKISAKSGQIGAFLAGNTKIGTKCLKRAKLGRFLEMSRIRDKSQIRDACGRSAVLGPLLRSGSDPDKICIPF